MNSLTIRTSDESKRKRLLTVLAQKKKTLLLYTTRFEMLKNELELIKREYYIRVGSLLKRDNELDLEIIKYKNLLALLREGKSRKQADAAMKDRFYAEMPETDFNDLPPHESDGKSHGVSKEKLKQLWKKIVMKFHPDLTFDPDEKKQREEIMKKVNKAYADEDYEALEEIYKSNHGVSIKELDITQLEQMLVQIENSITRVKKDIALLKLSEWHSWKKKITAARKTGSDIFRDLEHSLLDDIVKKVSLLSALKKDVESFSP